MSSLAVADRIYPLTRDGRLVELLDWTMEVAEALARGDGLVLTKDHWEVVDFMRAYYREYGISPILKLLKRGLNQRFREEKASDEYLERLFPGYILYQGTKIAGIPAPHLDVELDSSSAVIQHPIDTELVEASECQPEPFEFEGQVFLLSKTGNLIDMHMWDARVAAYMAEKEGIRLTADHWIILNYLRKFFFSYGITPMVKILMKHLAEDLGQDKANHDYLYSLFPRGPSRQGSRIAGLPAPQGCIDPW